MGVIENFHRYVVVFQYGSAVLFNVTDEEAEGYLEIIRKYSSGLLPDMRKDGNEFSYKYFHIVEILPRMEFFPLSSFSSVRKR